MPCGSLWSPCTIELMLGEVEQLQVLVSTVDKFPALEDHKYEREKLFVKEERKKEVGKKEAGRKSAGEDAAARPGSTAQAGQGLGFLE